MSRKEFFVGYEARFPAGLKAFYVLVVTVLIIAGAVLALGFTHKTPPAGSGAWHFTEQITLSGVVRLEPYPMLVTGAQESHAVLLVRLGKLGAQELLKEFDGKSISISGVLIERGPWKMLEIEGSSNIEEIAPLGLNLPELSTGKYVTLQGEIVDSKCMLGAMKPGAGKVHRACAQLCIIGGLPPMLLIRNDLGEKMAYLLTDNDGRALGERIIPWVAVPIEISGEISKLGNMSVLKVNVDVDPPRRPV